MTSDPRFRPLDTGETKIVEFEFDGERVRAPRGVSVAAALLRAGISRFRSAPVSGAARGPYCLMGVCFECTVEIEGLGARQACLIEASEGLRIRSASGI